MTNRGECRQVIKVEEKYGTNYNDQNKAGEP